MKARFFRNSPRGRFRNETIAQPLATITKKSMKKEQKSNVLIWIVLINSIIALFVDAFLGFSQSWVYGAIILLIEIPLVYVILKMFDDKKWAFIITIIYFSLRSFNFYFEDFYFFTKNGINLELNFTDQFGINLISFIVLILILVQYSRIEKNTVANNGYN